MAFFTPIIPNFASPMALIPRSKVIPTDETSKKKVGIQAFARELRQEVSDFLEYSKGPKLPIFFVKSYNHLKKMAKEINHEDQFLNFIPNVIQMQILTEFGPSENFPKVTANGFLEDKNEDLYKDISQFYKDIVQYVKAFVSTGTLPDLPYCYFMTLEEIKQQKDTEENKKLIDAIPQTLQHQLTRIIGDAVPQDYVEECTKKHFESLEDQRKNGFNL